MLTWLLPWSRAESKWRSRALTAARLRMELTDDDPGPFDGASRRSNLPAFNVDFRKVRVAFVQIL